MLWDQPPPQALRFSHGRGERETRVTGDDQRPWEGYRRQGIFIERETSGYEAALGSNLGDANVNFFPEKLKRHTLKTFVEQKLSL